ncbi:basic amino acid ABC transporter substrate-binding protein [Ammonifex thiophilus]|uniref:Basic amino acid ABC transporter substrate-binding protein n=1 Tax=Ammonifex thiophilus TaxID=444093 RepID=A0A3D8P5Q1_9THEO|nr:basic amino acid ABC transporter substrate-binding protein [Ammonifex thiophilus]RDV84663.1 basic amino acid ABC transporter substrate-binding protein [Ammonifex thiophilus]
MKKLWSSLCMGLVLVTAILFSGCGAPGSKTAAESQKSKYVVATEASFAPFEFRDDKTGQITGFDIDLMKALAATQGFDVEFKDMGFDGIIAAVKTGSVDMAISAISIDEERKKQVNFSLPYYQSGLRVAVRADNQDIKTLKDLEGKKIAAQLGTTGAKFAKSIPGAKVVEFNTANDAFMELINGGVDAFINDYPVTAYFIKQGHPEVKVVKDICINSEFYGIAVPKNRPELLQQINEGLKKLKENGQYAEIYRRWFGEDPPSFLPGEPPVK